MLHFIKPLKEIAKAAISFQWTNTYGIARSLLAAGLFLTLLFNNIELLVYPIGKVDALQLSKSSPFFQNINLFKLFDSNLQFASWIGMSLLFLVIVGWRPRITGIFHWWVTYSFATTAIVQDGGDQISQILTLLLIPVCLTDSRKWHWAKNIKPVKFHQKIYSIIAWSTMLVIQLQVAIVYFHAAIAKLNVEEWVNGTSMFYWIQNPIFGIGNEFANFIIPLFANAAVVTFLTWGTLIFEVILFMGIVMRPEQKKVLMVLGIGFHFAIIILFGLVSFFFAMTAALILYLGPQKGFQIKNSVLIKWKKISLFLPKKLSFNQT